MFETTTILTDSMKNWRMILLQINKTAVRGRKLCISLDDTNLNAKCTHTKNHEKERKFLKRFVAKFVQFVVMGTYVHLKIFNIRLFISLNY